MAEKLTATLTMRMSDADVSKLAAVSARFPSIVPGTLARVAMRIGLEAIERDPAQLLTMPIETRGGARVSKNVKRKASAKPKTKAKTPQRGKR